jgi:hypothetical protein
MLIIVITETTTVVITETALSKLSSTLAANCKTPYRAYTSAIVLHEAFNVYRELTLILTAPAVVAERRRLS